MGGAARVVQSACADHGGCGRDRGAQETLLTTPTFAGLWTDQPGGGILHIAFAGDANPYEVDVAKLAPEGAIIQFDRVTHSRRELVATRDAIEEARYDYFTARGVDLAELGLDLEHNLVRVGVRRLTPAIEDAIRAHFVGPLEVYAVTGGGLTACTTRSTCKGPPWRAGILGSPWGCSMAFVGYVSTTYYLMTAGHCADVG